MADDSWAVLFLVVSECLMIHLCFFPQIHTYHTSGFRFFVQMINLSVILSERERCQPTFLPLCVTRALSLSSVVIVARCYARPETIKRRFTDTF